MKRSLARKTRRRAGRLHPSPLAIALDGAVFASVALMDGAEDAASAVREVAALGGRVFVGVEIRRGEVEELRRWLDDASYECLAFILGARRGKTRK